MKTPSYDETKLIGRLAERDESALRLLYQEHGPLLRSVARRITGDWGEAEEIVQDTFFQLWRGVGEFDSSRGSLIGWLLVLARHRSISRVRERRRGEFAGAGRNEVARTERDTLESQIVRELVSISLSKLPDEQRGAVMLAYLDGLSPREIFTRTGVSPRTTKRRVRSALGAMKAAFSQTGFVSGRRHRPASLYDILATESLALRPHRKRDPGQTESAIKMLRNAELGGRGQLIDCFLQIANRLCKAGSSGLSFLVKNEKGEQVFRWTNLAGKLSEYVGVTTPRNFSPCGVTLDRGYPQLFCDPGRYFTYFSKVPIRIAEGLVIPFDVGGKTRGTVWICSHENTEAFDFEDAQIMSVLTEFVSCALHVSLADVARG